MTEKLDIILFGVTGLVGRYALRHLHKLASENRKGITWGVSGRNEAKIRNTLNEFEEETSDVDLSKIPIILADMKNIDTIKTMVKRTKVIINACGPLRQVGEAVIIECLRYKTHYIDVSAEPNFIETMEMKYNDEARKVGVYILNSCGVDSMTYDMGIVYLQKILGGTLNSVETYFRFGLEDRKIPGPEFNVSTWRSAIDLVANSKELYEIRKRTNVELPRLTPKLTKKIIPFKTDADEGWAVPSITADQSIMQRTQQYMYKEKRNRPIQIQTYMMFTVGLEIIFFHLAICIFVLLTKFQFGRDLLRKNPGAFTFGAFGHEEPSREKLSSSFFRLTLVGKGWKEKLSDPMDSYKTNPDTEVTVRVKGRNPSCGATSLCLVMGGIALITETENLPKRGGVFTPGAAFCDTSLIEQLDKNGVYFDLIKKRDISK